MRTFTNEEIAKIHEVRKMVSSICKTTSCKACPLSGFDGCEEGYLLTLLDSVICCAQNK